MTELFPVAKNRHTHTDKQTDKHLLYKYINSHAYITKSPKHVAYAYTPSTQ